jgi:hypothetical protein
MAQVLEITGKTRWFGFLNEPRDKYGKPGKEWSTHISTDKETRTAFRDNKVKNHIKDDEDFTDKQITEKFGGTRLGKYTTIRRDATDKEGNPLAAIKVVDALGEPWPQDKWVGNGSTIKAVCSLTPFGPFKDKETGVEVSGSKLTVQKIVIVDHVPYQAKPKAEAVVKAEEVWADDDAEW